MRRGENARRVINRGACDGVAPDSVAANAGPALPDAARAAAIAGVELCTADGCRKGACMDGIDLQQSCPLCPCGAHGIELQHCVAGSGVVIAPQSSA